MLEWGAGDDRHDEGLGRAPEEAIATALRFEETLAATGDEDAHTFAEAWRTGQKQA